MPVPFSEKFQFFVIAFKKHWVLLAMLMVFFLVGSILIFIGWNVEKTKTFWFLIIFGSVFVAVSIGVFLFTMPSSFMYYYEQELLKKYGKYATAVIINKYSKTSNYLESNHKNPEHTQVAYFLDYRFEHNAQSFTATFIADDLETFEAIKLGYQIPIQYLSVEPQKSTVRIQKLRKELSLK